MECYSCEWGLAKLHPVGETSSERPNWYQWNVQIQHWSDWRFGLQSVLPSKLQKKEREELFRTCQEGNRGDFLSLSCKPVESLTNWRRFGYWLMKRLMRSICSKVTWTASLCWEPQGAYATQSWKQTRCLLTQLITSKCDNYLTTNLTLRQPTQVSMWPLWRAPRILGFQVRRKIHRVQLVVDEFPNVPG